MKKSISIISVVFCLFLSSVLTFANEPKDTDIVLYRTSAKGVLEIMVLGPPLVADTRNEDWEGATEWSNLAGLLEIAKRNGVETVSLDVWWGLAHIAEGRSPSSFNWKYYVKLFKLIHSKGLKLAPILSKHRYGGNVNDPGGVHIGIPNFVVSKIIKNGWAYVSEYGNTNTEAISPWGLDGVMPDIQDFYHGFLDFISNPLNFADNDHPNGINMVEIISKLVIGMGPAGELVYPAYHSHDRAKPPPGTTSEAEFPGRGVLQHCSVAAVADFQKWLAEKYTTIEELNAAWLTPELPYAFKSFAEVVVLKNHAEVSEFFSHHRQYSAMGQDFFDWYHSALLKAGLKLGNVATDIFHAEGSALNKKRLAMKTGGVHWQWQDRLPLLTAGLTTTRGALKNGQASPHAWQPKQWAPELGAGLNQIFTDVLVPLRKRSDWVGIFTCAEMDSCRLPCMDMDGGHFGHCSNCIHASEGRQLQARSGARDLVRAYALLGREHGVPLYLENALEGNVYNPEALGRMERVVREYSHIHGLSLLRLSTAMQSDTARDFFARLKEVSDREHLELPCSQKVLMLANSEAKTEKL
jgi:hypothetical protein